MLGTDETQVPRPLRARVQLPQQAVQDRGFVRPGQWLRVCPGTRRFRVGGFPLCRQGGLLFPLCCCRARDLEP